MFTLLFVRQKHVDLPRVAGFCDLSLPPLFVH